MNVRDALCQGRLSVARALAIGATSGPEPDEETLSWQLLSATAWYSDRVTIRAFTRHEENRLTGADWLWWWEGHPNEWFGCLVQAKRLKYSRGTVTFDFGYLPRASSAVPHPPRQIDRLLAAADGLQVPAAYVLYRSPTLGPPDPWRCELIEPDLAAGAATFVAAAVVNEWFSLQREADLNSLRPIDCLTCPGLCTPDLLALSFYARGLADSDVREMLVAPPDTPARRAFRAILAEAVQMRLAHFRPATLDERDALHSGLALGEHFMRGVREPPRYVTDALDGGGAIDAEEVGSVAGVVVISNS